MSEELIRELKLKIESLEVTVQFNRNRIVKLEEKCGEDLTEEPKCVRCGGKLTGHDDDLCEKCLMKAIRTWDED